MLQNRVLWDFNKKNMPPTQNASLGPGEQEKHVGKNGSVADGGHLGLKTWPPFLKFSAL